MQEQTILLSELLLKQQTGLWLTPNQRLASFLEIQKLISIGSADKPQTSPLILSLSSWLKELWQDWQLRGEGKLERLLSPFEEELLWEKIISESAEGEHLLRVLPTAISARDAYQNCQAWQIPASSELWLDANLKEDNLAFFKWANLYEKTCQAQGYINFFSSLPIILNAFKQGILQIPKEIFLIGVEELTPLYQDFIANLETMGTVINQISLLKTQASCFRLEYSDSRDEVLSLALWAKSCLAESHEPYSIGIVVPNLESKRLQISEVFQQHLKKEQYNLAAPIPLTHYAIILNAFLCLNLLTEELEIDKLSQWLRSPFVGGAFQEDAFRATLDVAIRKTREPYLSWPAFIKLIQTTETKTGNGGSDLCLRMQALQALLPEIPGKKPGHFWLSIWLKILEICGWPGPRIQNSEEYQLVHRWQQLMEEYQGLFELQKRTTFKAALHTLRRLAEQSPFLPQSAMAPIQILGILEAAGLPFQKRWIMGLERDNWPANPSPNPFLPLSLQKKYQLPRSSAERELELAQRFTQGFMRGAETVYFSHTTLQEGNRVFESPLIAALPKIELPFLQNFKLAEKSALAINYSLETYTDIAAPALKQAQIKGGMRALQLQAACPFRAFAEVRLQALPFEKPSLGLSAEERGEILHEILALFWQGLEDQAALKNLSETALQKKIAVSIQEVLLQKSRQRPSVFNARFTELEENRLLAMMQCWLTLEKQRPPFSIQVHELDQIYEIGSLELKLRIDRLDILETGAILLLDYKTGDCNTADWFGPRPLAPQLPLYCLALKSSPGALAFARLKIGKAAMVGLSQEEHHINGIKSWDNLKNPESSSFAEQLISWQAVLDKLALEFSKGQAQPDPREGALTCRFCSLQTACRIQSYRLTREEGGGE